jgi:AGZA family xanthine/uracil permease-like MFS transporter
MKTMRSKLEAYFRFAELNANWRTELLAGLTTFITMAYIVFVNPSILSKTGMPIAAVTAATCLCAAFGSILMGAVANYPLALAPGMGLNAYFTYTVVLKMGIPWQTALGAVFLSGVLFLALTFTGIRQRLLAAIPHQLHAAVAGGIGLFIAFIGLRNAGIIVPSPPTTVTLGNLRAPETALALFGLLLIAVLQAFRVRASILIGVLGTMALGILFHQIHWQPTPYNLTAISATAFHLDIPAALHVGAFEIIFVFLFVDLFDNIGTLVAVAQRANLIVQSGPEAHTIPSPPPHLRRRRHRYYRRLTHRHQHCHQLHRVLRRSSRLGPYRCHRHRHRTPLSHSPLYRPPGRCNPQLRHRTRAHPRRGPHARWHRCH